MPPQAGWSSPKTLPFCAWTRAAEEAEAGAVMGMGVEAEAEVDSEASEAEAHAVEVAGAAVGEPSDRGPWPGPPFRHMTWRQYIKLDSLAFALVLLPLHSCLL